LRRLVGLVLAPLLPASISGPPSETLALGTKTADVVDMEEAVTAVMTLTATAVAMSEATRGVATKTAPVALAVLVALLVAAEVVPVAAVEAAATNETTTVVVTARTDDTRNEATVAATMTASTSAAMSAVTETRAINAIATQGGRTVIATVLEAVAQADMSVIDTTEAAIVRLLDPARLLAVLPPVVPLAMASLHLALRPVIPMEAPIAARMAELLNG
jgi:hypothetical protein